MYPFNYVLLGTCRGEYVVQYHKILTSDTAVAVCYESHTIIIQLMYSCTLPDNGDISKTNNKTSNMVTS